MKFLFLLSLLVMVACQKQEASTPQSNTSMVKVEEDCDQKAKEAQKVEIKEEGISLSEGNTGCTLDEAQK
ncbi:MAG: hypothetical protein K2P81_14465 [Bacteriovoracaceae bacterium]|nr:hypothetical protein [Bacteriovoracaceae bacterium]